MQDAETEAPTQPPRPTKPTRPTEEIVRLGREKYERDIRPQVEADHVGEVVAIDVDTGDWALEDDETAALDRLRSRRPETINVFCERVGFRAMHSLGGGNPRRTD